MAWRLANSLSTYRNQINNMAPQRSRISDGTIGDAAHQGTTSDHNPRLIAGLGSIPIVTAIDITHDPIHGCNFNVIAEALRLSRDSRIKYVIWNKRQFSATIQPWVWRSYSGDNPHDKHGHLSVVGDLRADSVAPWSIGGNDMDLNAIGQIIPGLSNATVLADIWKWGATVRFGNTVPRADDRFGNPTWPGTVTTDLDEIKDKPQVEPAPVDVSALARLLEPIIEAAAERAVRKVLGSVDGATP